MARIKATPKHVDPNASKDKDKPAEPANKRTIQTIKVRKQRRYRPGTVALREIRKFQRGTELLLKRAPFRRCVREIAMQATETAGMRFTQNAFLALQTSAEDLMTELFRKAQRRALDRKKITITAKDFAREFQEHQERVTVVQALGGGH
ncbi:MAG: hypothetical protein CL678_00750 [Bdellovibrionaceae bacterium]|nr:hypothetical protein [Pseudobdellovibrionaceae bacterium]